MPSKEYINSSLISAGQLDALAIESGLIRRRSAKFSAEAFLLTLLGCAASGMGSLNQMCARLATLCSGSMARQSLAERFGQHSTAFMVNVLCSMIARRSRKAIRRMEGMPFKRVLIEDSTFLSLGKGNGEEYPASGNKYGTLAGVKIDFGFDLLTGNVIGHTINSAIEPDQSIGQEFLAHVREGDLVLRDMGYFKIDEFREIKRRKAFWLSRLPDNVNATDHNGRPLEALLAKACGSSVDTMVTVGENGMLCRMVAVRADEFTVNLRHRKQNQGLKQGRQLAKRQRVRANWHIMVTNMLWTDVKVGQLEEIYRARWNIEIQFRAWKQSFNLHKLLNRKSSVWHMEALLLASMIAHQIAFKLAGALETSLSRRKPGAGASLSYEKFYDHLSQLILTVSAISGILNFSVDIRYITRDKRSRKTLSQSMLYVLT